VKSGILLDVSLVPNGILINLFRFLRMGIAFPIDDKGSRINMTFGIWRAIATLQLEIRSRREIQTQQ